MHQEIAKTIQ